MKNKVGVFYSPEFETVFIISKSGNIDFHLVSDGADTFEYYSGFKFLDKHTIYLGEF